MSSINEKPPVSSQIDISSLAPFIAGISGGAVSTTALYPLDLIKVRLQVNEDKLNIFGRRRSNATSGENKVIVKRNRNLICSLRNVIRHEGFLGLYQGLTPAVIGSAISWGGYFFFYERFKNALLKRKATIARNNMNETTLESNNQKIKLGGLENFMAACTAGAVMVLITNPIWLIKTRMQLQLRNVKVVSSEAGSAAAAAPYRGVWDAARTIIREEGPLGLYKGAIPAIMLVSHGGVQFVTYEFFKHHFGAYTKALRKNKPNRDVSVKERLHDSMGYLTFGAISKIIASTATYPLQVIKSRLQQRSQTVEMTESGTTHVVKRNYKGVIDCTNRIWRNEGFVGFFKGCVPNALRVAPSAAITFVVYEGVMDLIMGVHHRH